MRINRAELYSLVERINICAGKKTKPYTKDSNGNLKANVGTYCLSWAYSGVCFEQMDNEGGGVTQPFHCGYIPKRELYDLLQAFIAGLRTGQGATK